MTSCDIAAGFEESLAVRAMTQELFTSTATERCRRVTDKTSLCPPLTLSRIPSTPRKAPRLDSDFFPNLQYGHGSRFKSLLIARCMATISDRPLAPEFCRIQRPGSFQAW